MTTWGGYGEGSLKAKMKELLGSEVVSQYYIAKQN